MDYNSPLAFPSEQPVNPQRGKTHFPGVTGQFNTWQVSRHSAGTDKSPPVTSKGSQGDLGTPRAFLFLICLCATEPMPDIPPARIFSRSGAQNILNCLTQSFLYLLESLFALLTPRKLINYFIHH